MSIQDQASTLLARMAAGDDCASDELFALVYEELRSIAAAQLRQERAGHTLQATALVHEAYLRLSAGKQMEWSNKAHFFKAAARAIRHVLVDHARKRAAAKRGGGWRRTTLREFHAIGLDQEIDVLPLDKALSRLADLDARQAQVVELRFFAGLSVEHVARVLQVSPRTVEGDWSMARAWLHRELGAGSE